MEEIDARNIQNHRTGWNLTRRSFAEATKAAVAEAAKTVRNMDWFEVVDEREGSWTGAVAEFQVTLKIGFRLER